MLTPELSSNPGCEPINRAYGMSLADVMEKIENDQTLEPTPKKKMLSAIRTACRVFRANPKFVPAEPRNLSRCLDGIRPRKLEQRPQPYSDGHQAGRGARHGRKHSGAPGLPLGSPAGSPWAKAPAIRFVPADELLHHARDRPQCGGSDRV